MVDLRKRLEDLSEKIQERAERFYNPTTDEIQPLEEWSPQANEPVIEEELLIDKLPWIQDIDPKETKGIIPSIPIPYRWRLGLGFILFLFCLMAIGQLMTSVSQNMNSLIFMMPLTFIQLDYLMKTWRSANKKWYFSEVKQTEK